MNEDAIVRIELTEVAIPFKKEVQEVMQGSGN